MTPRAPTSVVLDGLLGPEAPEQVTLGWLLDGLGDRSFGVVLLVLALLGLLPGVSAVAGVLLAVPAFQMVLARPGPVLPRRVAARRGTPGDAVPVQADGDAAGLLSAETEDAPGPLRVVLPAAGGARVSPSSPSSPSPRPWPR